MDTPANLRSIDALLAIMARLRSREGGCPWDVEQTFATIAPYTIEEAYEVADAIERNDIGALKDELGDLLFQVVFHAQMAAEAKAFTFADVVEAISDKMLRRHPHVFGTADVKTAEAQTIAWEEHKKRERAARTDNGASILDDVPLPSPALTRALKLQKRMADVGFDWRERGPILDKLKEEIGELTAEMDAGAPKAKLAGELGDILFVCVNLARHLGVDAEDALRGTNAKVVRRFKHIEEAIKNRGDRLGEVPLDALDRLWDEAKAVERQSVPHKP